METKDQIQSDLKMAMKSGDTFAKDVLRFLSSDIKNEAIKKQKDLTEEEVLSVIKRNIKSRKDAANQFVEAGRNDLAEKEEKEISLLGKYMPEQMSEDQIEEVVKDVIAKAGADSRNFGLVMKEVMLEVGNRADGSVVSMVVKKALTK